MNLTFFHRPKPKSFNYKPIYSNPEEEKKIVKNETEISLKDKFQIEKNKTTTFSSKKGVNIFIYLIVIILMLYIIFFT